MHTLRATRHAVQQRTLKPWSSLIDILPVGIEKMDAFRQSTPSDDTMQKLRHTISREWPKKMSSLPRELQEYWNFQDELHEADGLVLRGDRLVVPSDLRQDMLKLIHESHEGMDKCKSRARTVLYCPGSEWQTTLRRSRDNVMYVF